MQPKVGIILLNWNNDRDTLSCLNLLNQLDYPRESLCITVVDNGSNESSLENLKGKSGYELICLPENRGYAAGNNVGIQRALQKGCEFVLILNSDIHFSNDLVSKLLKLFENDPLTGIASPKIYFSDEPKRIWYAGGRNFPFSIGTMIGFNQLDQGQFGYPKIVDFAVGCCMLVRDAVYQKIGFFDESFFFFHEDIDFSRRARAAGFSIWYQPEAILYHRVSATTSGDLPRQTYLTVRSRVVFFRKHTPVLLAPLQIFIELLRLLRFIFRSAIKGHFKQVPAYLKGLRDGLSYAAKP